MSKTSDIAKIRRTLEKVGPVVVREHKSGSAFYVGAHPKQAALFIPNGASVEINGLVAEAKRRIGAA